MKHVKKPCYLIYDTNAEHTCALGSTSALLQAWTLKFMMRTCAPHARWLQLRHIAASLLLGSTLLSAACATSDPNDTPSGQDQGADMPKASSDMGDRQDQGKDLGPDLNPPPDMNPCGECCPGTKMCTEGGELATCRQDGSGFDAQPCEQGMECMQDQCVVKKVCEPGQTSCFDEQTQLVCRPNGSGFATNPCPANTACVQGQCASGQPNGATCAAHEDCAGGKCHCGSSTSEGCAKPRFERAYCAAPCSSQSDCSDDEWCFSADTHVITSQVANYNHCVPRCQGTCTLAGMACRTVGVLDEQSQLDWQQACYFPAAKDIGQECTSDEECLGGTCLKDYFTTGYCTRRCEQGGCPDNAACVELKTNERYCSLKCGDGASSGREPCPLDEPTDRLDVTCKLLPVQSGGAMRVCTKT